MNKKQCTSHFLIVVETACTNTLVISQSKIVGDRHRQLCSIDDCQDAVAKYLKHNQYSDYVKACRGGTPAKLCPEECSTKFNEDQRYAGAMLKKQHNKSMPPLLRSFAKPLLSKATDY